MLKRIDAFLDAPICQCRDRTVWRFAEREGRKIAIALYCTACTTSHDIVWPDARTECVFGIPYPDSATPDEPSSSNVVELRIPSPIRLQMRAPLCNCRHQTIESRLWAEYDQFNGSKTWILSATCSTCNTRIIIPLTDTKLQLNIGNRISSPKWVAEVIPLRNKVKKP